MLRSRIWDRVGFSLLLSHPSRHQDLREPVSLSRGSACPPGWSKPQVLPILVIRECIPAPNPRRSDRLLSFFSAILDALHRKMACSGWNTSIGQVRGHEWVVSSCVHDELASQLFSVTLIDFLDQDLSHRQLLIF